MKALYKCKQCQRCWSRRELRAGKFNLDYYGSHDVPRWIKPGFAIPFGLCPTCQGHCFPLVQDLAQRKVLTAIAAMWDAASDIIETTDETGMLLITEAQRKQTRSALLKLLKALSPSVKRELRKDARTTLLKGAR